MSDPSELHASPLHALCVYAEPLVAGSRVAVFGDATLGLGERLLALGARVVHVYDPNAARAATTATHAPRALTIAPLPVGDFEVRDGAFDLALVIELSELAPPNQALARIRRLLSPTGTALVRTRARVTGHREGAAPLLDYYELYDLVAMQFPHVRMVGEVPWAGVALAELGQDGDDPGVSVDTDLVSEAIPPDAFIAIASQEDVRLAPYALIQVPTVLAPADIETTLTYGNERADLAAAQLRASVLDAQVEELRALRNRESVAHGDALSALEAELADRLSQLEAADGRLTESGVRLEQARAEARAQEVELASLRDRLALALREIDVERASRAAAENELKVTKAALHAGADELRLLFASAERVPALEVANAKLEALVTEHAARLLAAEDVRAKLEGALATALVDLDSVRQPLIVDEEALRASPLADEMEAHGIELVALEESLRERARIVFTLERELERRERIILDLVHALEEARAAASDASEHASTDRADRALVEAESALREARYRTERAKQENDDLRKKLDASALEVARREGEMGTLRWRIQELEQVIARLEDEQTELTMTIPPPAFMKVEREANDVTVLAQRLAAAEDELDLVRQALAQEHEARARAESGEALAQARQELARQAVMLEKLSRELEAHDGTRRGEPAGNEGTAAGSA
jgi:SAM-dependent methyltransferase